MTTRRKIKYEGVFNPTKSINDMEETKKGDKLILGKLIGKVIKVREPRYVHAGDANGNPVGEKYETQDVYVSHTNPITGKTIKAWWDLSECKPF